MAKVSSSIFWYLLILFLSFPTIKTLIRPGYFPMHDDMQAMRVYQMDKCIKDGQIPCRWVQDMGYRYGYPQFNYYSPLPYYFMEITHLGGLNILDAVKLGFAASLILGNLAMFALAKTFWGNWGGLLSAMFYAYTPYRASDIFSRGAMGESWAFVFMPLILLAIYKTIKQPKLKSSAFLALSLGGLMMTHNISTLIFLPLATIWGLFLIYTTSSRKKSKVNAFKFLLVGGLWAAAVAAFFFLPVIFEKKYAHIESMLSGYFNYLAHFVNIKQLFFTSFWSYGSSQIGPADDLSFFISPLLSLVSLLSLSIAVIQYFKHRTYKSIIVIISIILALFSSFMTHSKSTFIWSLVPPLKYLQFPWRFLSVVNLLLVFSAGYFISINRIHMRRRLSLVLITLIFLLNASFFTPQSWYDITPLEKFSGTSWEKQLTISIFDYLPIFAKFPPNAPASDFPHSPSGRVGILDMVHKSNSINFIARSASSSAIPLYLPQYDFPGWKVYLNGRKINHNHDNPLGLIALDLPPGDHAISAKLTNTPVRSIGNLLSLISIPPAIYICFFRVTKPKKSKQ